MSAQPDINPVFFIVAEGVGTPRGQKTPDFDSVPKKLDNHQVRGGMAAHIPGRQAKRLGNFIGFVFRDCVIDILIHGIAQGHFGGPNTWITFGRRSGFSGRSDGIHTPTGFENEKRTNTQKEDGHRKFEEPTGLFAVRHDSLATHREKSSSRAAPWCRPRSIPLKKTQNVGTA